MPQNATDKPQHETQERIMKEYIGKDGIPVREYELEDIPKLINGELTWVFGLTPTDADGGRTLYRFTPEAEKVWNEHSEAKEKTYWENIDKRLETAKRVFQSVRSKSPNEAETIADRIREGEWRLNPDSDPNAPKELLLNPASNLKQAWATLKRGQGSFDNAVFHYNQIMADTEYLFLKWLKAEQQAHKPEMIAGQAFAFADGKLIEKPALQTIVEYFNEEGAEVQLFTKGNELALLSLGIDALLNKDNTDLEADAREADPSELQALFDAKFKEARDSGKFKTPRTFAKAEANRLLRAWAGDADRLPIVGQWQDFLKDIAEPKQQHPATQPRTLTKELRERFDDSELHWFMRVQEVDSMPTEPVTKPYAPPKGNEGGTGAENGPQPQGIIFTNPNTLEAVHDGLKGFFRGKETELLTLLEGGKVDKPLHFPHQQNRLAEVFSRAHHLQKVTGTKTDIQNWIARNFTYLNQRSKTPTPCNPATLRGIFSPKPEINDLPRNKRIEIKGLPYVPYADRVDRG